MKRIAIYLLFFCSAAIGVSGFLIWREDYKQRLNLQLITAIKRDDMPSALLALQRGADPDTRDETGVPVWWRILELVSGHRNKAPTALLVSLQLGEKFDGRGNRYDVSPNASPYLVNALLAHGAQINVFDHRGYSPLWYALYEKKTAISRLLINHGAHTTTGPATDDVTRAILYGDDTSILDLILSRGADSSGPDSSGLTPLGAAVVWGNSAKVRCLLHYHANPNILSKLLPNAKKPLEYAEKNHLLEIAKTLRSAGAKE